MFDFKLKEGVERQTLVTPRGQILYLDPADKNAQKVALTVADLEWAARQGEVIEPVDRSQFEDVEGFGFDFAQVARYQGQGEGDGTGDFITDSVGAEKSRLAGLDMQTRAQSQAEPVAQIGNETAYTTNYPPTNGPGMVPSTDRDPTAAPASGSIASDGLATVDGDGEGEGGEGSEPVAEKARSRRKAADTE